jgi:hypothetical protein
LPENDNLMVASLKPDLFTNTLYTRNQTLQV